MKTAICFSGRKGASYGIGYAIAKGYVCGVTDKASVNELVAKIENEVGVKKNDKRFIFNFIGCIVCRKKCFF